MGCNAEIKTRIKCSWKYKYLLSNKYKVRFTPSVLASSDSLSAPASHRRVPENDYTSPWRNGSSSSHTGLRAFGKDGDQVGLGSVQGGLWAHGLTSLHFLPSKDDGVSSLTTTKLIGVKLPPDTPHPDKPLTLVFWQQFGNAVAAPEGMDTR